VNMEEIAAEKEHRSHFLASLELRGGRAPPYAVLCRCRSRADEEPSSGSRGGHDRIRHVDNSERGRSTTCARALGGSRSKRPFR